MATESDECLSRTANACRIVQWCAVQQDTEHQEKAMKIKNLDDLFLNELRDIYHAEKQLVKALPKMAKAASSSELRSAFEKHLEETRHHVERLEEVFRE